MKCRDAVDRMCKMNIDVRHVDIAAVVNDAHRRILEFFAHTFVQHWITGRRWHSLLKIP